ncbi:MAG: hypothetical protein CL987_03490 [Euryarchaeota archaeon]|nr:hypothetical protein [Euryarchaeota archaeon]
MENYMLPLNKMSEDLLLIDGQCGLCSWSGQFLSKRLKRPLKILEQDSETGMSHMREFNIEVDSLVLIKNNHPYVYSSAAIRCLLYLGWHYRILFPFAWLVPKLFRDLIYKSISKNRRKLFHNKD